MNSLTQQALSAMEDLPETMQAEILDFIQFLKLKLERSSVKAVTPPAVNADNIGTVLERLAQRQAQCSAIDPHVWQQDTREDRVLVGRD